MFIHQDFLLQSKKAKSLYHEVAKLCPIIDFHNHLSPQHIQEDHQFENLAQIWLDGDHYKWRAMRACGVPESHITGSATDFEKFQAWAATLPKLLRNPLYHWSHLELTTIFGIAEELNSGNAKRVWDECNEKLKDDDFSVRSLLEKHAVQVVATTDDPVDSLVYHKQHIIEKNVPFTLVPTLRPDKGMEIDKPAQFMGWLGQLSEVTGLDIRRYEDLKSALALRYDHFNAHGCRASDHGVAEPYSEEFSEKELDTILEKVLAGVEISDQEAKVYKSAYLYQSAVLSHERDWVFQLHIGAFRNNSSRRFAELGPDSGFDSIGDRRSGMALSRFLNRLDLENKLPKTVLYSLNSADNEMMITMAGNFQEKYSESSISKIQFGPPWWFHDSLLGIEQQLDSLSSMGVLSQFIGMTTDSRSILSFPRHEYFRRILCNVLGNDVEKGILPDTDELIHPLIENICYQNALTYFRFNLD